MAWVIWDDEHNRVTSTVKELPESVRELDRAERERLGYRPLLVDHPEDFIPRFPALLGSSVYTLLLDGRVAQTFPNADFSEAAVRRFLVEQVHHDATRVLAASDWMVVRQVETGKPIPEQVSALRARVREHAGDLSAQIDELPARELVDFTWVWPTTADQTFVEGVPIIHIDTPPAPIPDDLKMPAQPVAAPVIPPEVDGLVPVTQEEDGVVLLYRPDGTLADGEAPTPYRGARQ